MELGTRGRLCGKRRAALLALLALNCQTAILTSSGQSIDTGNPQLALQGRFSPGQGSAATANLPEIFSWPASSIYASFTGASTVAVSIAAFPQNGSLSYGINWFRFFIDGKFSADGFTSYNQLSLEVTLNVSSSGSHVLRIAKVNDGSKGEATLKSIRLSSGGRFTEMSSIPGQEASRRILILGDSYTVGYGNAGAVIPGTCKPSPDQLSSEFLAVCSSLKVTAPAECADLWQNFNQNGLEAFGSVAAAALGADFQVVARSGSGMVGYSFAADANPDLSPEEYEAIIPSNEALFSRSVYTDSASNYSLQSWTPQVVVVASGTNDWHSVPPLYALDAWLDDATDFLQQISDDLDQPDIIIQVWPAEQQFAGARGTEDGLNETEQYLQAMPSLYTAAVKRNIPNVHYLQLDTSNYDNLYDWCDGHPSAAADRAVAEQLVAFIEAEVPGWNVSAAVELSVDQQAIRPNTSLYYTSATAPSAAAASAG